MIAISERMPEIGRQFYGSGGKGLANLRAYLEKQTASGSLAIDDCELAAAQFLDSCHSTIFRPMLFNAADPPSDDRINHIVGIAVRAFLAAYRPR